MMLRVLFLILFFVPLSSSASNYFSYDPAHPILQQSFQARVDKDTSSLLSLGNEFEILIDTTGSLSKKLEIAKKAKKSIFLNTMIYMNLNDDLMESITQTLIEKASSGVGVYLLMDHKASYLERRAMDRLEKYGVNIHYFNRFMEDETLDLWVMMHEKYMVVDQRELIIGGQNMANQSENPLPFISLKWRDTDLYVKGPLALQAANHFKKIWNSLGAPDEKILPLTTSIQPVTDQRTEKQVSFHQGEARFLYNIAGKTGEKNLSAYFLKIIKMAQHTIYWQGNHMILPKPFERALKAAAKRGVNVTLMTNGANSAWYMPGWNIYHVWHGYRPFLGTKVKVQVYQKRFNHSKILYVDGVVASIGSANHDTYSLKNDAESTVISYDRDLNEKVYQTILNDLKDTHRFWMPF